MPKKTSTPLRYPGGKVKLVEYTKALLKKNDLGGCTYVEPFAGGCGLAIQLLLDKNVDRLILNDIDLSIYAIWDSIINESEALIDLIANTEITIDEWHKQSEIQKNKEHSGILDLGFSTLFLNRTNRSGIINAGPIGGKKQNGNYKLSCRFNKGDIIERIRVIAKERERIDFYNLDASDFINKIINGLDEKVFVFIDPPYHIKGPGLYMNHFKDKDHALLAEVVGSVNHPWVVTYDNSEFIINLYNEFEKTEYALNYSAQNFRKGTEIMIYAPYIKPVPINFAY